MTGHQRAGGPVDSSMISDHTAVGSNPTAESNCYFRFSQKH